MMSTMMIMFVMFINRFGGFVNATVDIDPGNDFNGYMNEIDRLQHEELIYEEKLVAHEEWRQTTWGGWSVRQAQLVLNHFKPFLILVLDTLTNTNQQSSGSSIQQCVMYIGVRMFVIGVFILLFYSCQKIVQVVVGNNDIEVIEEIIIIHEHDTEEEASKARSQTTRGKRSKSTNKQKSQ
mmetsp:Transcript_3490/g.4124  ORF Transcript_3490/g.4124 Transcript_3490/m.4124 type:complete len:180 (+) Transcript_3490:76-615(+)